MGPLPADFPTLCYGSFPLLFPQGGFAVPERYISILMQPRLLEKFHLTSMTWKLISWVSVVTKSMVLKVPSSPRVPLLCTPGKPFDTCSLNSLGTAIVLRGSCKFRVPCRMQVSFSNSQGYLPICRSSWLLCYYVADHSTLFSLENL